MDLSKEFLSGRELSEENFELSEEECKVPGSGQVFSNDQCCGSVPSWMPYSTWSHDCQDSMIVLL